MGTDLTSGGQLRERLLDGALKDLRLADLSYVSDPARANPQRQLAARKSNQIGRCHGGTKYLGCVWAVDLWDMSRVKTAATL